ncbi:MAG: hypothetical protein IJV50_01655 [Lachnospiraceae bacterium]|nr:hypothetical protein [Lachnospiraceae bacterium]
MKNKWICKGMILLLLAGLVTGCGKKNSSEETKGEYETTRAEEAQPEQETKTAGVTAEASDWGVSIGNVATNGAQQTVSFTIHVPYDAGAHIGTGIEGIQGKNIRTILDQQMSEEQIEEGTALEEVLPALFPQTMKIYQERFGFYYENGQFEVSKHQNLTINGRDMCCYEGQHSWTYEGEDLTYAFVAYTTQLSNGMYVYWMAIDETEDQSSFDLVAEYAEKMADTFREEE